VIARLDRARAVAEITVRGPGGDAPAGAAGIHGQGAGFWTLAMTRGLDDLILDLRTNELEAGTWVLRTSGDAARVLGDGRLLPSMGGKPPAWGARQRAAVRCAGWGRRWTGPGAGGA
jgi:benzoyl-CoA-dihydrodiol lyase